MLILVNQLQVNHSVIVMQINGPYPRRSDPGNRYFSYVKANGIAFMTDCQQRLRGIFWLIIHYVNDLSVITLKLHVDSRRALITRSWLIFLELSLLDLTIAGSHQQRSWHIQPIKNQCLDNLFTRGQADRLRNMLAHVFPAHVSQFMHRPIDQMAKIGEHEKMRQRTGFLNQQRIVVFSQTVFFNIGSLK